MSIIINWSVLDVDVCIVDMKLRISPINYFGRIPSGNSILF